MWFRCRCHWYLEGVKQVVKVRILPIEDQAVALRDTLHVCNEAASWLSAVMHTDRAWSFSSQQATLRRLNKAVELDSCTGMSQ